jgi:hypothetical protein
MTIRHVNAVPSSDFADIGARAAAGCRPYNRSDLIEDRVDIQPGRDVSRGHESDPS